MRQVMTAEHDVRELVQLQLRRETAGSITSSPQWLDVRVTCIRHAEMPSTSRAYYFRPNNQRKDSIVPFHGTGRSRPTWDVGIGSGSPGGGGWKNRQ